MEKNVGANKVEVRNEKVTNKHGKKLITSALGIFCLVSIILSIYVIKNRKVEAMEFPSNIVMYINKEDPVTIGEYLIYAASISQEATEVYGDDVWSQVVEVNNGDYVTFEEYTKQEICEQIKLTHLLAAAAVNYNIELSEDELKALSTDAQEYHNSLSEVDSGTVGIDLALILKVYKENLLAEKVYNEIISDVEKTNEMFDDDYEEACIRYFEKKYEKISNKEAKNWSYETHVNVREISNLELAKTSQSEEEAVADGNENNGSIILESLVGMDESE